tara:strand:- start:139 stop:327 length:189 start_codon:yes stop_codon:yes gene_type:complete
MDQTLDMQVAALIFLAGTKSLVTSEHPGGVEMTSEEEEDLEDPAPSNISQMREPSNYGSIGI